VVGVSYHHAGPPSGPPRGRRDPGRPGRGPAVRVDPVIVEVVAGLAWLAVGTLGLDADGAGTLILAVGIAAIVFVVVENRRRGPRVFDAARSGDVLRAAAGAIAVVVVASILLGLIGSSAYLPGVAAIATGAAFLYLHRSTGQRPTLWLGGLLVALGVLSAFITTQTATGFVSQGLLGLVAGLALLASAADRVGLLEMLRDRAR
jgi:uncharacterized RDD family membrane protein YckC